jgi:hypothetical protein
MTKETQASREERLREKAAAAEARIRICDDYRSMVALFLNDELRANELGGFQQQITHSTDYRKLLAEEEEATVSRLLHRTPPPMKLRKFFRHISGVVSSKFHRVQVNLRARNPR